MSCVRREKLIPRLASRKEAFREAIAAIKASAAQPSQKFVCAQAVEKLILIDEAIVITHCRKCGDVMNHKATGNLCAKCGGNAHPLKS